MIAIRYAAKSTAEERSYEQQRTFYQRGPCCRSMQDVEWTSKIQSSVICPLTLVFMSFLGFLFVVDVFCHSSSFSDLNHMLKQSLLQYCLHCYDKKATGWGNSKALWCVQRCWHWSTFVGGFFSADCACAGGSRLWEKSLPLAVQLSDLVHGKRNGRRKGTPYLRFHPFNTASPYFPHLLTRYHLQLIWTAIGEIAFL